MKVYIDWSYSIKPKSNHTWTLINNPNQSDVIISVNKGTFENNSVVWLYEPEAIIPTLYTSSQKYKKVATHKYSLSNPNKIVIPPCIPAWVNGDEQQIYTKKKLVNMIASTKNTTKGHKFRMKVAEKLKDIVDVIGFNRDISFPNKVDALKDYMFSVAMENCISDGYYTEKILDCFLTGTIPIYWGTKKILDVFDQDGILFLNEDGSLPNISEEIYKSKNKAIQNNFEIARKVNYNTQDGIQFIIDRLNK